MMSSAEEEGRNKACCASCGIAEVDDVKLKDCSACKLVRYCGVKCQRKHRPQHKKECKKRMAELRDELLFKQPESNHMGDCPICCLPLSLVSGKSSLMSCCSKIICAGCAHANVIRQMEGNIEPTCPFCRHPPPKSQAEARKNNLKRIEANDAVAIFQMGQMRYSEGDYDGAFEYWTKAAELGSIAAHNSLSILYQKGEGVEKDEKKEVRHLEHAAIAGHPFARHNLGRVEWRNGRMGRAVKHWIIAANHGHDGSLDTLKKCYGQGLVSKEDFTAALRAHLAAVDATKNPQREAAESLRKLRDARAGTQSN